MEDSYEATIKRIEATALAIKAKDDAYEEEKKALQELEEQLAKSRAEIEEIEKERAQIAADQARDDKELEVVLKMLQSRGEQVEKMDNGDR
ncbi:hypothetical protein M5689_015124 [Euphorbia peplus]|nr:hypothetical protein M5689_015124 [Euphorbia peplus]